MKDFKWQYKKAKPSNNIWDNIWHDLNGTPCKNNSHWIYRKVYK
jgi:hypothetical protein